MQINQSIKPQLCTTSDKFDYDAYDPRFDEVSGYVSVQERDTENSSKKT